MTSIAVGNRRLLRLAKILDTADALHKKRKEPTYDQSAYEHSCGTPACAWGHWSFYKTGSADGLCRISIAEGTEPTFAISSSEDMELFSSKGCNGARTAKQAAKYIRAFVKRRQKARK